MAIKTFPTLIRRTVPEFQFGMRVARLPFQAPFTAVDRSVTLPADRWKLSFPLENIDGVDRGVVEAFLIETIRANVGRFYCWNLARPVPVGTASGAPLVNGASQTGTTLATDGWTANQTACMRPGDMFQVNGELKMITEVVASNASGQATLVFEPPLRASPANNAIITIDKPVALFRLEGTEIDWMTKLAGMADYDIAAVEVFQ